MNTKFLFPNKFKKIGWLLLVPSIILGLLSLHMEYEFEFFEVGDENFTNEFAGIAVLVSLLFIGFSKMRIEDEYTMKVRLDSLLWSIYVNYAMVLIAFLVVYGGDFFTVVVYNIYTPMIIYIARFHYYFYKR